MSKLIVGLGNPGNKYTNTRHNVAWLALDHLGFSNELIWTEKFKGLYSSYSIGGEKVYFLKPLTFMNLSGESVAALMSFFKIERSDILILQDEIDLPYGTVMLKNGGGLAGHNGLKSITQCLGSQDFHRLRIGVGRPVHGSVSSYVLSDFSQDEKITLDDYLNKVAEIMGLYIENGFEKIANRFNKKNLIEV